MAVGWFVCFLRVVKSSLESDPSRRAAPFLTASCPARPLRAAGAGPAVPPGGAVCRAGLGAEPSARGAGQGGLPFRLVMRGEDLRRGNSALLALEVGVCEDCKSNNSGACFASGSARPLSTGVQRVLHGPPAHRMLMVA